MKTKLTYLSAFVLLFAATAWGLTRMNSLAIWNSTVENRGIGRTPAPAGHFTSVNASSVVANTIASISASVNGAPTVSGNNGFTGWGKNGTGDMDFIAANSGASPSFYWYYLLGSSQPAEMFLDQNANRHVPNG